MERIAAIIVNYNDYTSTKKLLDNIVNYDIISYIVIVDNSSDDESYEKLCKIRNDKVFAISAENNGGYARGNNIGIKYAIEKWNVDIILVSNPDVYFEESLVMKLCSIIRGGHCKVGLVTARIHGDEMGVWKLPKYWDLVYNNLLLVKKIFGDATRYSAKELQGDLIKVDVVAGSFFMCSTKTMEDVGFFDENTFLYCEENILAHKLKKKGYKNILCNTECYIHMHSVSIDQNIKSLKSKYAILYNSLLYYNHNYLRTIKIQDWLFRMTFKVGLDTFVLVRNFYRK